MAQEAITRCRSTWLPGADSDRNWPSDLRAASAAPRRSPERARSHVGAMDAEGETDPFMPALSRFTGAKRARGSRKMRISIGSGGERTCRVSTSLRLLRTDVDGAPQGKGS